MIYKACPLLAFMKAPVKILIFLAIISNFVLFGYAYLKTTGDSILELEVGNITRIIDGDTIEVNLSGNIEKIRLLGINTPEKNREGYKEAKDFLSDFTGREIELVFTLEDLDKYGRKLRYIFYEERFINKEILENGLAHFYTYKEDRYTQELRRAEDEARNKGIGVWKKSSSLCSSCIKLEEINEIDPGEYIILKNICDYDCDLNGWTIDDDSSSHTRKLDFSILALQERKIDYEGSVWNDDGDSFYLRDNSGLVEFYRY